MSHNGSTFGDTQLHFGGGCARLSTKYKDGKCPRRFVAWFFNNSKSLKSIASRRPEQWVNVYNCHFSYSYTNFKLIFTADVTWKYTFHEQTQNNSNTKCVWQKLCDTQ